MVFFMSPSFLLYTSLSSETYTEKKLRELKKQPSELNPELLSKLTHIKVNLPITIMLFLYINVCIQEW